MTLKESDRYFKSQKQNQTLAFFIFQFEGVCQCDAETRESKGMKFPLQTSYSYILMMNGN